MMERRSSLMIARDILEVATGGSTVTPLVYKCNLNFKLIKTWLSNLIDRGLIEFIPGKSKTWRTTRRGLDFLLAMDEVMPLWNSGL